MNLLSKERWQEIKMDYVRDSTLTQETLAKKYNLTTGQIRNRSARENWASAREDYARAYGLRLQELAIRDDAPELLKKLNKRQLQQSDELRVMLNLKLKMKTDDGRVVLRPEVGIIEIRMAVAAFAELYRMDRLALGASTDNIGAAVTVSRYDEMSEKEILEELRQVRARVLIPLEPGP